MLVEIRKLDEQLKDWALCVDRLQCRYEELRKSVHDAKSVVRTYETALGSANQSKEQLRVANEKLVARNKDLDTRLSSVMQLLGDDKPEAGRLVTENAELKKRLASAKSTAESTEREAAFAREQYQAASAAILEMRREVDGLRASNEELQRRADERVVKLRQLRNDTALAQRDALISGLKTMLKERDDRIQRLEAREAMPAKRNVARRVSSPAQSRASSPGLAAWRRGDA